MGVEGSGLGHLPCKCLAGAQISADVTASKITDIIGVRLALMRNTSFSLAHGRHGKLIKKWLRFFLVPTKMTVWSL